jgi:hypothetical protein
LVHDYRRQVSGYYIDTLERREAGDLMVQPAAYEEAPASLLAKAAPPASMDPGPLLKLPAKRKLPAAHVAGKLPAAAVAEKLPAAVAGKLPIAAVAWKLPAAAVGGKLPAVGVAGKLPAAAVAGKLPAAAVVAGKLPAAAVVAGKLPAAAIAGKLPAAVAGRKRRKSAADRSRKRKLRKAAQLAAISWPTKWEVRTSLSIYSMMLFAATLCSEVIALLS